MLLIVVADARAYPVWISITCAFVAGLSAAFGIGLVALRCIIDWGRAWLCKRVEAIPAIPNDRSARVHASRTALQQSSRMTADDARSVTSRITLIAASSNLGVVASGKRRWSLASKTKRGLKGQSCRHGLVVHPVRPVATANHVTTTRPAPPPTLSSRIRARARKRKR